MKIKTIFRIFLICSSSMSMLKASGALDPDQSMKSIHSLQASREQVNAFRNEFKNEINQRKNEKGFTYEAIAALDVLADAINALGRDNLILDKARLDKIKGAALGAKDPGKSEYGNSYYLGTREFLQSLFKAITMGIGYKHGVVNADLSDDEKAKYRSVIESVNPYFDFTSQKSKVDHLIAPSIKDPEKQAHINEVHRLLIEEGHKNHRPIIFGSSDEKNRMTIREGNEYGCEFSNCYEAPIKVNFIIMHPLSQEDTPNILDLSDRYFSTVKNFLLVVKHFILTGQEIDFTAFSPTNLSAICQTFYEDATPEIQDYWDAIKNQVMIEALKAKFSQHPKLAAFLLRTNENTLVNLDDGYWGVERSNGVGGNWLGKALVHVRQLLKTQQLNVEDVPGSDISPANRDRLKGDGKKHVYEYPQVYIKSMQKIESFGPDPISSQVNSATSSPVYWISSSATGGRSMSDIPPENYILSQPHISGKVFLEAFLEKYRIPLQSETFSYVEDCRELTQDNRTNEQRVIEEKISKELKKPSSFEIMKQESIAKRQKVLAAKGFSNTYNDNLKQIESKSLKYFIDCRGLTDQKIDELRKFLDQRFDYQYDNANSRINIDSSPDSVLRQEVF